MQTSSLTFPCPQCNKNLKWKPEIAGKTGKCACGARVRAPDSLAQPSDDDVSLLYDLAGPDKQPEEPPVLVPPPLPAQSIGYATRAARVQPNDSAVDTSELLHEVYLPLAVLLTGFIAILVWAATIHPTHHAAFNLAFMSVFNCITLFIKTVVLTLVILAIAKSSGGSLGNPVTLVLKIAALIIFLDAAETWIRELLKYTGAIDAAGKGPIATIGCSLLVSVIIAICVSRFVYRLDGDAARVFGRVMAWGNWAMNWAFVFLLTIFATAVVHAAARARAVTIQPTIQPPPASATQIPSTPTATTPPLSPAQTAQDAPTPLDGLISQHIKQNPFRILEGYAWCRTGAADDAAKKVISDFYAAGAEKVYVDGFNLYAQLPDDPAKRSACLDVAHAFRYQYNGPDDATANNLNHQYAALDLLTERLSKLHHRN
jgi:hypothetical protein